MSELEARIKSLGGAVDESAVTDDDVIVAHCSGCKTTWNAGGICHCASCHLTFLSLSGFDKHRIGRHEPYRRRCRTETELRRLGMEPDWRGYWRKPRPEETLPSKGEE